MDPNCQRTTGGKQILVERLDKHQAAIAASSHAVDVTVVANGGGESQASTVDSNPEDRDEIDELTELAIDQSDDLAEAEDPELEPDGFDGADQEDLLE